MTKLGNQLSRAVHTCFVGCVEPGTLWCVRSVRKQAPANLDHVVAEEAVPPLLQHGPQRIVALGLEGHQTDRHRVSNPEFHVADAPLEEHLLDSRHWVGHFAISFATPTYRGTAIGIPDAPGGRPAPIARPGTC